MRDLPFASIQNDDLRLDYLTTTGPRIIGLFVNGVEGNLLVETPHEHWSTPHGEYYLRGGHRLWTAPEDPFFTPPEAEVEITKRDDHLTIKSPVDAAGLQREITIQLESNIVHLVHRIIWHGENQISLAPWAITQLRLGGVAILPFHKGNGLLPDRNLVLWNYSELGDNRLELHDGIILVHARATGKPFKIGTFTPRGWIAYAFGNALLVKRFRSEESEHYPDLFCNAEIYVGDHSIELESLGSLHLLQSGEQVTHEESWEVCAGEYPGTLESARKIQMQLSQS